jgi:hypothetical protein
MPDLTQQETAPERLRVLDRQLLALQLRKQGGSYRQIASTLVARGSAPPAYNMRSAHRDVQAAYKRLIHELTDTAEEARALDLERVDELFAKVYPRALALDYVAFDRVITLLNMRARYLGLFQDVKQKQGPDVNVAVGDGERTMVVQMHWPDMPPPLPGDTTDPDSLDEQSLPAYRLGEQHQAQGALPAGYPTGPRTTAADPARSPDGGSGGR